ncbi:MAG: DinB family protein [Bacteroidota bacterium]
MEKTAENRQQVLSSDQLLESWQGHRSLTRRVIEAFPEDAFFELSIGGMRPFAGMVKELLAIAEPGLREMATGKTETFDEYRDFGNTKAKLLQHWDEATEKINALWEKIEGVDFQKEILSFGQFPGTVQSSLFYFIENEIHHRGQGYVYLRSLGIVPPLFYER